MEEKLQTIKEVLMERDGMSEEHALNIIAEAKAMLVELLEDGDLESAIGICEEYFGLEQDYIMELFD